MLNRPEVTVIARDDLVETLMDRKKHPSWQWIRVPMVLAFAKRHDDLWLEEYARIRNTFDPKGRKRFDILAYTGGPLVVEAYDLQRLRRGRFRQLHLGMERHVLGPDLRRLPDGLRLQRRLSRIPGHVRRPDDVWQLRLADHHHHDNNDHDDDHHNDHRRLHRRRILRTVYRWLGANRRRLCRLRLRLPGLPASRERLRRDRRSPVCPLYLSLIISGEIMTTTTHPGTWPHSDTSKIDGGPKRPELSIVMASCRDYAGVWSTTMDIVRERLALGLVDQIEIVCVANEDDGLHVEQKRKLFAGIPNSRFVHMPTPNGTAIAKNRAIAEATGLAFVCLDCHVLLHTGVLAHLVKFWRENAGSRDLYHGPNLHGRLVADDKKPSFVGTHFAEVWGSDGMWGQWRVHEPAREPDAEPFRIPMSGCGLFSAWRESWPGFHDGFRGFGPEEGYIHARYRQLGGEVWCLPWLQWIHRYGHTDPVMYPNNWLNRTLGYLLSLRDVGYPAIRGADPLDSMRSVCVQPDRITAAQWDSLVKAVGLSPQPAPPPQPAAGGTGLPALNEWDKQYLESMPCQHRGRQEALILCNRGCPSQQSQAWAAFQCKLTKELVTLGNRRSDLKSCLNCEKREQQEEPALITLPAGMTLQRYTSGPQRLAVLCCYFNPIGRQSIRENYLQFRALARAWNVPVFAAEVAFGDEPFLTTDAFLQLRGGPQNVLWQKERLLNRIVEGLPPEFDAVAWIDTDIGFDDLRWPELAINALRLQPAVQLFRELRMLGPDRETMAIKHGIGGGGDDYRKRKASPGGAWAARRHVFPLYDRHVVGGGDSACVEAWIGMWDSWLYQHSPPLLQADWRRWAENAWQKVRRGVSSLPLTAEHWYHGDIADRGYGRRTSILAMHAFDPNRHVRVVPGGTLLEWTPEAPPELVADVAEYFRSRNEDAHRAAA